MDPYKRLQLARKNGRPSGRYYIENLLTDFVYSLLDPRVTLGERR